MDEGNEVDLQAEFAKAFDNMVDRVRKAEAVVMEYDRGIVLKVTYEALTMMDSQGTNMVISDEVLLDHIHLLLEVRHTARQAPMDLDFDMDSLL